MALRHQRAAREGAGLAGCRLTGLSSQHATKTTHLLLSGVLAALQSCLSIHTEAQQKYSAKILSSLRRGRSGPKELHRLSCRLPPDLAGYFAETNLGVFQNQGYHFGGPNRKDHSILGSIWGPPYFGKLPYRALNPKP